MSQGPYDDDRMPPPPPPPHQPYPQQPYLRPGYVHQAPYGVHPRTGAPYSEKSKIIAGILQILLPLGLGRFYMGDVRTGVIQLLVVIFTCGLGSIWPIIDGIMILVGEPTDERGQPLRG